MDPTLITIIVIGRDPEGICRGRTKTLLLIGVLFRGQGDPVHRTVEIDPVSCQVPFGVSRMFP